MDNDRIEAFKKYIKAGEKEIVRQITKCYGAYEHAIDCCRESSEEWAEINDIMDNFLITIRNEAS